MPIRVSFFALAYLSLKHIIIRIRKGAGLNDRQNNNRSQPFAISKKSSKPLKQNTKELARQQNEIKNAIKASFIINKRSSKLFVKKSKLNDIIQKLTQSHPMLLS